ncbi:MAG: response regulator [Acidobacteria bacterium]|nr:response regulator [Acidobacteriota bacterium]
MRTKILARHAIHRVLIVDDDPNIRSLFVAVLGLRGYASDLASNGEEAIQCLRRRRYNSVLLDLMLPGQNGFDVLQYIRAERPRLLPRVIVVTAASRRTLGDVDTSGVRALVRKPFDVYELLDELDTCCDGTGPPE